MAAALEECDLIQIIPIIELVFKLQKKINLLIVTTRYKHLIQSETFRESQELEGVIDRVES
jgi:hypothetical protein